MSENTLVYGILVDVLGTPKGENKYKQQYRFDCPTCVDLYDGEGKMTYSDDAKLIHREKGKDIISIIAGRSGVKDELRVKLIIKHSNPDNHLRNVRVLMPGGVCSNNPFKRIASKKQCRGSYYLSFEKHHARLIFNPAY